MAAASAVPRLKATPECNRRPTRAPKTYLHLPHNPNMLYNVTALSLATDSSTSRTYLLTSHFLMA